MRTRQELLEYIKNDTQLRAGIFELLLDIRDLLLPEVIYRDYLPKTEAPQGERCSGKPCDKYPYVHFAHPKDLPQETVDVEALGQELFQLGRNYEFSESDLALKRRKEIIATLKSLTHHD